MRRLRSLKLGDWLVFVVLVIIAALVVLTPA